MTVAHGRAETPPPRRVALLRGVNLGRAAQLSMPALAEVARMAALASGTEQLQIIGTDVFGTFPDGQASSRLAAGMVRAAAPAVVTARNLTTMSRLAELLQS